MQKDISVYIGRRGFRFYCDNYHNERDINTSRLNCVCSINFPFNLECPVMEDLVEERMKLSRK